MKRQSYFILTQSVLQKCNSLKSIILILLVFSSITSVSLSQTDSSTNTITNFQILNGGTKFSFDIYSLRTLGTWRMGNSAYFIKCTGGVLSNPILTYMNPKFTSGSPTGSYNTAEVFYFPFGSNPRIGFQFYYIGGIGDLVTNVPGTTGFGEKIASIQLDVNQMFTNLQWDIPNTGIQNTFHNHIPCTLNGSFVPPPIVLTQPSISISPIQINAGSNVSITGQNFRANTQVKVAVTSSNSELVLDQIYTTNSTGGFSTSYASNINSSSGIYTVSCRDIFTNQTAPNRIFEVIESSENYNISIVSPSETTTIPDSVDRIINVEWIDKMIPGSGYSIVGSKRNFKYSLNYSTDDGNSWEPDSIIITGYDFINSTPLFRAQIDLNALITSRSGLNIKLRVTDLIKNNRYDYSASFPVRLINLTRANVKLIWDYSYPERSGNPIGACADGVSRFYIKVSKVPGNTITGISIYLSDDINSNSQRVLGKLTGATITDHYDDEAYNAISTTYNDNISRNDYWVWYVSPDDFNRYGGSDDSKIERIVKLNITVSYSSGLPEAQTLNINIIRQPLMLVHGINSDHFVWDHFRAIKNIDNLFKFVSTPDMDPKGLFNDNALLLLNWGQTATTYTQSFKYIIQKARNSGYASNQVSYVAHSMGGSMVRAASQNHYYKTDLNYHKGFVNRIITVDTPHEGSPLADFLVKLLYYIPDEINFFNDVNDPEFISNFFIYDINHNIVPSPAVINLQSKGVGKFNFEETHIPTFLIAGDFLPGTEENLDNVNWEFSYNNEFNNLLNKLDFILLFTTKYGLNFLFYKILDYPRAKAILLNPFMKKSEKVFKLLNLIYNKLLDSDGILPNSDFVVALNSQLAGTTRSSENTFDRFNGDINLPGVSHTIFYSCTEDNNIANSIIQHLNLPTYDNSFTQVIRSTPYTDVSNDIRSKTVSNLQTDFDSIITITILSPQNGQNFYLDSLLNLSFNLSDTAGLKYVKVYFQGESYYDTTKSSSYNFNLSINGNKLDSSDLIVNAVFLKDSNVNFSTDSKRIFIKTNNPVIDFQASNDFYFLIKDKTVIPKYRTIFNNQIYEGTLSSINASIENPSVITFDNSDKSFKALSSGETFAVVSNGGKSDTIYFSVIGEILIPGNTNLNAPFDSAVVSSSNLKFSWNTVDYASYYDFQIAKDINFSSIIFEENNLSDTSIKIHSIEDSLVYYWRVKGINSTGSGDWSSVRNFMALPIKNSYLRLTLSPQGLYKDNINQLQRKDTISVYLVSTFPPFKIIDSANTVIDSVSLNGVLEFINAPSGKYYIKVKHFNLIETWSKAGGEIFTNNSKMEYDFTTYQSQAYGNNLVLKGTKYCIYSGDVNQDGVIDLTDIVTVYNDVSNFSLGYLVTDLNGDNLTDLTDLLLAFNNSINFVSKITP